MIPWDNFKPGMVVAATNIVTAETSDYGMPRELKPHMGHDMTGVPMVVLSVSYPWIAVTTGRGRPFMLDLRHLRFVKVTNAYACTINPGLRDYIYLRDGKPVPEKPAAPAGPERDPRECPRCGTRLRQRKVEGEAWRVTCATCNWTPPPPPPPRPQPAGKP